MLRRLVCGLCALLLFAGVVFSDELRGKVKKVNADKGSIVVTVDGKDREIPIDRNTKFVGIGGKELPDGLRSKDVNWEGQEVVITTEKKDGMEFTKSIRLGKGGLNPRKDTEKK